MREQHTENAKDSTLNEFDQIRDHTDECELATPLDVANQVVNACADAKGKDITVLNVTKIFDLADYFIVVSARSDRQVQGIANKITESLAIKGVSPSSVEGMEEGQWVLMDLGEVVVHIFYEAARAYYDIEGLWAKAKRLDIARQPDSGNLELKAA